MFSKVLIANRGVAAVRIARTLNKMGITSVALRTDAEANAKYFQSFDEVCDLGSGPVSETYLNIDAIIAAATQLNVEAIHPGYGFLSENASFARAVAQAGMVFIGPSPETIETFGLKHTARELSQRSGVSMLPGTPLLSSATQAIEAAEEIGFPVILKSTAGGGGIGMQRCANVEALAKAFDIVKGLAASNFASSGVYLEKYLDTPRHVEVQIFGDGQGTVQILGDRDCSLQRRHQKLVEECPAPFLPEETRTKMHAQAASLAREVNYASAGTVEFLYDAAANEFYFLEVNTRLQVEHGVTECVWQIDLVEWMVKLASGDRFDLAAFSNSPRGTAIQARLYAEDPFKDFQPAPGDIDIHFRTDHRVDTWVQGCDHVAHQFDPMIANIICSAATRAESIEQLESALRNAEIYGVATNRTYLVQALALAEFRDACMSTRSLATLNYQPCELEIIQPGLETTVQSYPGRQGLWEVGVPPSGPMDDLSFRLGNRLLGNPEDAAGLEVLFSGPSVQFRHVTEFVYIGGTATVTLDDLALEPGCPATALAGQTLTIGQISTGLRGYLLFKGGLDVKAVVGSAATFTLGKLGGHQGRPLRHGDVLRWKEPAALKRSVGKAQPPDLSERLTIRMLFGPHTAPDFFTQEDISTLFSARWRVHHNSSRTGVRFIGPQPQWARADGGEAGLHPSNIHDNAYAFGALDFTGDMPVILGPDGPSLGGFVCPAVVINADRWKLGQLQPGDEVEFKLVSEVQATQAWLQQLKFVEGNSDGVEQQLSQLIDEAHQPLDTPVLWSHPGEVPVRARRAGQEWILLEFGQPMLDIASRIMVQNLMRLIADSGPSGACKHVIEMTPGVRSLQVRFDFRQVSATRFLDEIKALALEAAAMRHSVVPSRVVHMPLSWDDPACQLAVERYMSSVRPDAPWCPDNIEFIRRINGLESEQSVKQIVFDASYLVLGLGDVYLGAPVATPVNPCHRLVTTKYNPARTWTAENSVGIGGSYMCIYGMEGPGGYQFVGRTVPVWRTQGFANVGRSWLLDHFDQVSYFEVDAQTLLEMREASARGAYLPKVESTEFSFADYQTALVSSAVEIEQFAKQRNEAFNAELERWRDAGLDSFVAEENAADNTFSDDGVMDAAGDIVRSPMAASVWRITHDAASVEAGEQIIVLEAMKTEIAVTASQSGSIEFLVHEGQSVSQGQPLAVIR